MNLLPISNKLQWKSAVTYMTSAGHHNCSWLYKNYAAITCNFAITNAMIM